MTARKEGTLGHTATHSFRGAMAEMAAGSSFGVAEVEAAVVTSRAAAPSAPVPLPTCVELPSFETARALAENRYSCLVVVSHRRHIALPPRFLNRKRTGICAQLDAELRRYSDRYVPLLL